MIKKTTIIITFLLLIMTNVTLVLASTPVFEFNQSIKNNLITTINTIDYGSLVFIKKPYVPENHEINDFNNLTVQQFDKITWRNNKTLIVKNPLGVETLLVNGSEYSFNNQGVYEARQLTNDTNKFFVTVTAPEQLIINLDYEANNSGITINFSDNNFVLENEKIINEKITINPDLPPGEYKIIIKANNKTLTQKIMVDENKNFTVENHLNKTITIKSGESTHAGYLIINNNGNVDYTVTTTVKGVNNNQTYIISVPKPITLFRKSYLRIDAQIQVPTSFPLGNYAYELIVSNDEFNFTTPLNVTVIDNVKPVIEEINFSTNLAFTENHITVRATDNLAVTNVTMKIFNKTLPLKKDGPLFTTTTIFNKLSQYVITFCAYDDSNNFACEQVNKTFKKQKLINITNNTIRLPTKKIGLFSEKKVFEIIDEPKEDVIVELKEFKPISIGVPNSTYSARIIDGQGTIYRFSEFQNAVRIRTKGPVRLAVRSEVAGDFEGLIRIVVPDYVEPVSDVSFKVSFKDYDVPEPFSINWLNNNNLTCDVKDTGDLSTSYYDCRLRYPVTINPDELAIPTTVNERKIIMNKTQEVINEFNDYKKKSSVYIGLLVSIIILLSLTSYFFIKQYPYVNFVFGGKKTGK